MNPDSSTWQPGCNSLLCSTHFISGVKSSDPSNPDLSVCVMTRHVRKGKVSDVKRYRRLMNRRLATSTITSSCTPPPPSTLPRQEASCQTGDVFECSEFCHFSSVDREDRQNVGIQVFIPLMIDQATQASVSNANPYTKTKDMAVGSHTESVLRWRLKKDREWRALACVSENDFLGSRNFLLSVNLAFNLSTILTTGTDGHDT